MRGVHSVPLFLLAALFMLPVTLFSPLTVLQPGVLLPQPLFHVQLGYAPRLAAHRGEKFGPLSDADSTAACPEC